ncbi:DUF3024 domain-containing protein [Desulforhopalus sp. IMCC35007]|uniref:DUF3024 domain-containing protein n=1 Tax=Desulforhopalus sp. IMCC35007 TaxID=2569543 RepID=UPI0010AE84E3|nr:DUF3024 domain-containing protein [Desulforhopalus sp. IMCC35007]TKB07051.1 DUF3024 domain-containing protein [Desulforhopalus sp. IMCC35007]
MALSEFEIKRTEKLVAKFLESRRPEPHVRTKLDFSFRMKNQSVEIFSIRPQWDKPENIIEEPVAKATFVKTKKMWKLYWMRADLKWHSYQPLAESTSLEKVLAEIGRDPHGCFWG